MRDGAVYGDATRDLGRLQEIRRELHSMPEIGLELPSTQSVVRRELDALGLEVRLGRRCSSVVAVVEGAESGPTVLLRADMDALPISERSGEPFAATNGAMHACGHDLHMAGLIGAARLLVRRRDEMAGRVALVFQPGEEGHDGAQVMLDEGLLDHIGGHLVAAYAVHVGAGEPGTMWTRPGPLLAGLAELAVDLRGAGGHSSTPHLASDPVAALVDVASALHAYVPRRLDALTPTVVSITRVNAGSAINVIPESALLEGTVRTLAGSFDVLRDGLVDTVRLAAAVHRVTAETTLVERYPVTVNDPSETARLVAAARQICGADGVDAEHGPLMGSEDFSKILQRVPGAMLFVATTPPDLDPASAPGVHTPYVRFDDTVLAAQAAVLATAALNRLRDFRLSQ